MTTAPRWQHWLAALGLGCRAPQLGRLSADRDGRPNILVVMTDDMAAADVELMPNVQKLLAGKGTTFADAVDSFPLCCPARATFITGQYAHNHGVKGNFYPVRLVRDEAPRQHRCRPGSRTPATAPR